MAESFPGAIQIFAKALNMSELEMFKLMEQGKLLAADTLPKVAKAMKEAANAGGALASKMDTARVAQGQFFTDLSLAQDRIFKGGYNKGIAAMFQSFTKSLEDSGMTMDQMGKAFGRIFTAIGKVVEFLTPLFTSFIRAIDTISESIKYLFTRDLGSASSALMVLAGGFLLAAKNVKFFGAAFLIAFAKPLAILYTILGVFDEIRAFFDANVIGLFDDENMSQEERERQAASRRQMFGMESAADRKLLGSTSALTPQEQALLSGNPMSGGIPYASPITDKKGFLYSLFGDSINRDSAGLSAYDKWKLDAKGQQQNWTPSIMISNMQVVSPDPERAGNNIAKELGKYIGMYALPTN